MKTLVEKIEALVQHDPARHGDDFVERDDVIAIIKDHAELEDAINWPERKPITAEQLEEIHKRLISGLADDQKGNGYHAMALEISGGSYE